MQFSTAVNDAIDELQKELAAENISETCRTFLDGLQEAILASDSNIDVSPASIVSALHGAEIINGIWDTRTWATIASAWWSDQPGWITQNPRYATPLGLFSDIVGTRTDGTSGLPYYFLAVANPATSTVWVNGLHVSPAMMPAILAHEALHLIGLSDRQLAQFALGSASDNPSEAFQSAFATACF